METSANSQKVWKANWRVKLAYCSCPAEQTQEPSLQPSAPRWTGATVESDRRQRNRRGPRLGRWLRPLLTRRFCLYIAAVGQRHAAIQQIERRGRFQKAEGSPRAHRALPRAQASWQRPEGRVQIPPTSASSIGAGSTRDLETKRLTKRLIRRATRTPYADRPLFRSLRTPIHCSTAKARTNSATNATTHFPPTLKGTTTINA